MEEITTSSAPVEEEAKAPTPKSEEFFVLEPAEVPPPMPTEKPGSFVELIQELRAKLLSRARELNAATTKDGSKAGVHLEDTRLMKKVRSVDAELYYLERFIKKWELE